MNKRLIGSFLLLLFFVFFYSCENAKNDYGKKPVLLADREAPLGWIYLRVYEDSSFEFISRGLRDEDIYPGAVKLSKDTLFFAYSDSIPKAGKTAIINGKYVPYINGTYRENVAIKLNTLTK